MRSWKECSTLTMASGALAKSPPKKRHMKIVCKSWATATGIWKIAKTNIPTNSGRLRPYSSDRGPKIIGPKAKPRTNKLTPNTITSEETPNFFPVCFVAVLKTDEPNVTQIVISPSIMVITHFLHVGKFFGISYGCVRRVHTRRRESDAIPDHLGRPSPQLGFLSLYRVPFVQTLCCFLTNRAHRMCRHRRTWSVS